MIYIQQSSQQALQMPFYFGIFLGQVSKNQEHA